MNIFEFTLTDEDLAECLEDDIKEKYNSLSTDSKMLLLNKHVRSLEKGLEYGLTAEWADCLGVAISNTSLVEDIKSAN